MKLRSWIIAGALVSSGCGAPAASSAVLSGPLAKASPPPDVAATAASPALTLVESVPTGAMPDDPAIPNTDEVWRAMIEGATRSVSVGQFYVSTSEDGGRLEPVLAAMEAAVARGVEVRLLCDALFAEKYPEPLERLAGAGVKVRRLDLRDDPGGVLHAKYLLVDERVAYLGSANFDWRSLEHIHELGVRIDDPRIGASLAAIFEGDWRIAGGEGKDAGQRAWSAGALVEPQVLDGGAHSVWLVASPEKWLPDARMWELDRIVRAIDGAEREIRVQLLSYQTVDRDGSRFERIDRALRAAAERGVKVRLLLSSWQKSASKVGDAKALAAIPGVEVAFVNVPEAESGFIPFARVVHAKYLVVDDRTVWIGSSNWSGDYFTRSRNVSLVAESPALAARLGRLFDVLASGPLAERVDPDASYAPPKIAD